MTTQFPDVSQFQHAASLKGAPAVIARATEGDWLTDPDFTGYMAQAGGLGIPTAAYHFLEDGSSPAAQAAHCFGVAGVIPVMVDLEPIAAHGAAPAIAVADPGGPGQSCGSAWEAFQASVQAARDAMATTAPFLSRPTLAMALAFVDRLRTLGGICHLLYFPRWYWDILGQPSLKPAHDRGLVLVSSQYTAYSDSGPGWEPYGGMAPSIWQHTSTGRLNGVTCDYNAFKGTVTALRSLWATGTAAGHATKLAKVTADGTKSLHALIAAHPGNGVANVLKETLLWSRGHRWQAEMAAYVNAGDWDAKLAAGTVLRLWVTS